MDLTPISHLLADIIGIGLGALAAVIGTIVAGFLQKFTGGRLDADAAKVVQNTLEWAASWAEAEARELLSSNMGKIKVKGVVTKLAVGYAIKQAPKALKRLGLLDEERLTEMMKARLVKVMPQLFDANDDSQPVDLGTANSPAVPA